MVARGGGTDISRGRWTGYGVGVGCCHDRWGPVLWSRMSVVPQVSVAIGCVWKASKVILEESRGHIAKGKGRKA